MRCKTRLSNRLCERNRGKVEEVGEPRQSIKKGIRKVQTFQTKNEPFEVSFWGVCREVLRVLSP